MVGRHFLIVAIVLTLLGGCATVGPARNVNNKVVLQKTSAELPEDQLLDVWIELFDPGALPDDAEQIGLSPDIREAEARYMPENLRETMEKTGYWGAVRLVPRDIEGSEVLVKGAILVSDGEQLVLEITALDASGRQWFNTRYRSNATVDTYRAAQKARQDVFQPLYSTIANDLARYRSTLKANEVIAMRRIASLRFAADLSPNAFAGHLQQDASGIYRIQHLPAHDDPMYRRVNAIRERDLLLIDTLNGHFDNFYREMHDPYVEWRKARTEEMAALRKIEKQARIRKIAGAAAIIGAIVIGNNSDNDSRSGSGTLQDVLLVGGIYAIKSGFDKDSETVIHRDAIAELGDSFSEEARPLVVEVEGEIHELTGSAEVQYAKWRALLKKIYASETGFAEVSN